MGGSECYRRAYATRALTLAVLMTTRADACGSVADYTTRTQTLRRAESIAGEQPAIDSARRKVCVLVV